MCLDKNVFRSYFIPGFEFWMSAETLQHRNSLQIAEKKASGLHLVAKTGICMLRTKKQENDPKRSPHRGASVHTNRGQHLEGQQSTSSEQLLRSFVSVRAGPLGGALP